MIVLTIREQEEMKQLKDELKTRIKGKELLRQKKPERKKSVQFMMDKASDKEWLEYYHNLLTQSVPDGKIKEYHPEVGRLIVRCIDNLRKGCVAGGASFAQQYLMKKGLKVFGEKGKRQQQRKLISSIGAIASSQ